LLACPQYILVGALVGSVMWWRPEGLNLTYQAGLQHSA
jgi:hypothetical protein